MAGYSMTAIPQHVTSFRTNYRRLRLAGRRTGETAEGVAIERLNKMNLLDNYTLRVRTREGIHLYRLDDYFLTRPTLIMVKQAKDGVIPPIEAITVFYGHWRDYKTFPDSLMHWESDVVEKAGTAMGRRIRHEVVFAAVRMFGEIWGKRGTILGPG